MESIKKYDAFGGDELQRIQERCHDETVQKEQDQVNSIATRLRNLIHWREKTKRSLNCFRLFFTISFLFQFRNVEFSRTFLRFDLTPNTPAFGVAVRCAARSFGLASLVGHSSNF